MVGRKRKVSWVGVDRSEGEEGGGNIEGKYMGSHGWIGARAH
jgi:hypothetical protein